MIKQEKKHFKTNAEFKLMFIKMFIKFCKQQLFQNNQQFHFNVLFKFNALFNRIINN